MVEINVDWLTYWVRRQLAANCLLPTNSQNRAMDELALILVDVKGIGQKTKLDLRPFKKVVEHQRHASSITKKTRASDSRFYSPCVTDSRLHF